MKSLILKDIYNILTQFKSLIIISLFLSFIFIFLTTDESFVFVCTIIWSMQSVSSFSYDEISSWEKYALITPISREKLVGGKYIFLLILSGIGVLFGFLMGIISMLINKSFSLENILVLLVFSFLALISALIICSTNTLAVFKYGREKGRILMLVTTVIPVVLVVGVILILDRLGIKFDGTFYTVILCTLPVLASLWMFISYKISCIIVRKKEF